MIQKPVSIALWLLLYMVFLCFELFGWLGSSRSVERREVYDCRYHTTLLRGQSRSNPVSCRRWRVPEVFVEPHCVHSRAEAHSEVLGQQQKLGTNFAIVATLCSSIFKRIAHRHLTHNLCPFVACEPFLVRVEDG